MMEYEGYRAVVTYDDDAGVFHGEVVDTRDVITFQGTSVRESATGVSRVGRRVPESVRGARPDAGQAILRERRASAPAIGSPRRDSRRPLFGPELERVADGDDYACRTDLVTGG